MKEKNYYLDIVINKEKLSDGEDIYVSQCPSLGVASQGSTVEESIEMIKEAVEIYLEEMPEAFEELDETRKNLPTFSIIEVKRNDKTSNIVG
ncbi:MAG: type II toxin-antitoxin system HicB family antitoxin [Nanoarchaeota archaeon]|nr:type II toxin-antitoxin system HicB family antitoxin [Nanoarchaeota archaeon]MBU1501569.1 type II toxin-antitoxin system HicB family antitoxin [Nanoarchaeota archaeon]MBU2458996.1 type II toxin-antitoxin system HicB family antitoxin [Nanoarchaeota archaeon]MBU2616541.1 type II toxin-antitoxin system HicB family antitoxin [Nanoarchaeota archaeon]